MLIDRFGSLVHTNGSIGTTQETITFSASQRFMKICNTHATQSLSVSFNGGTSWFTILKETNLTLENVTVNHITLKGSNSNTTYEILSTD